MMSGVDEDNGDEEEEVQEGKGDSEDEDEDVVCQEEDLMCQPCENAPIVIAKKRRRPIMQRTCLTGIGAQCACKPKVKKTTTGKTKTMIKKVR